MADSLASARRTCTKGPESVVRSEALQRLIARRSSTNRRSEPTSLQVKISDPIYDTVPESDYADLVAKRRDDFRDFIVDDDGLGYTDDGHEEDWANHSDSGSDKERKDPSRRKRKREEAKKSAKPRPNPVVRQRISLMFTYSVFKKNDRTLKAVSLGSESILNDVLTEIVLDENDREKRRRRISRNLPENGQRLQVTNEIRATEMVFSSNSVENLQENGGLIQENDGNAVPMESKEGLELESDVNVEAENCNANVEVKVEEEKKEFCLNAKIKVEKNESVLSATEGWKAACGDDGNVGGKAAVSESNLSVDENSNVSVDENSDFELNANGSLPFYIIDAHEESFGGNLGTLYLFGKEMASGLKNEIAERLVKLNVSTFTMMPVKRSYAFERTDIPAGENYVLKINYPFKDPPLPADLKGENFTSLLGTHSSYN